MAPEQVVDSLPNETKSETYGKKQNTQASVKFRVEYVDPRGTIVHQYETEKLHQQIDVSDAPAQVFEIITTYKTDHTEGKDSKEVRFTATATPSFRMHILSGSIIHALRSIVQYYPDQDLSSDIVKIRWPYAILVHHYDELLEYREKFLRNPDNEYCYRERDAYEHIGLLKEFLDEHIMPAVEEERERNKRGFCTFNMLWLNAKPGTTSTSAWARDHQSFAVKMHSIKGGSFETPSIPWTYVYWSLEYDGEFVGRVLEEAKESMFDGEKEWEDSLVDVDVQPRQKIVEKLIVQGETYWNLLRKQCRHYKGKTVQYPHNEVDGLVMVDLDAYYEQHKYQIPQLMNATQDTRNWISDCTCSVCNSRRRHTDAKNSTTTWEDYEHLSPQTLDELDDDKYFLLPKTMYAYVFSTRSWELLHVDGFSQPVFEQDLIDNLVMDETRVTTLKALAKGFIRENLRGEKTEREPWSADFVKGKGSGLIILLHGNPGVGKTCTAECIAAFTCRPLMVLTSSDIGTDPRHVESRLISHFKSARRWGAVLLIDEADVFMERRTTTDLERNSLVAGFLRALEFYDGILFLTTNRVGTFDDAFMSRIHVKLHYPNFDDESRRKVWQTFITKLQRERGDYIRVNIDAKEYLEGKELKAVQWNGREIRNAFQTAVALAEFEAEKDQEGKIILTDKHLKAVVAMSRDFKDYLDDLHQGDEGKRAERRHERLNK